MKGDVIFFLFIGLLFVSLVSAGSEMNFQNEEIQPGETIFATITTSGEFTQKIDESQIKFLEGRKEVFFEFDLTHFNGTYYFYAYTTREGNFTLEISDILYNDGGPLQSTDIKKELLIQKELIVDGNNTLTEILGIKPGFIKTSDELNLTLSNKGNASLEITCADQELTLQPLEARKITFEQESEFELISCSTYKDFLIPVMRRSINDSIEPPIVLQDLKTDPQSLSLNITLGSPIEKQIELFNFGDENLTNFKIVSEFDFVEFGILNNLSGDSVHNLSLIISPQFPGHYEGNINISYIQNNKTKIIFFPLDFFILPAGSNETDFQLSTLSCAELNGNVCDLQIQLCNGTAEFDDVGVWCCQGNCALKPSTKKEGSGFGWIIGILIFAALGAGGYYLYQNQKKIGPQKPAEQLKEASDKLDERMKGKSESKRISGGLQRS